MLNANTIRTVVLVVGATLIRMGYSRAQAHSSDPKDASNAVGHSAKELVGRWVMDLKRSGPFPAKAVADAKEAARETPVDFLPGGRFVKTFFGAKFPGRYEVSGSKVTLIGDPPYTSKNNPPEVAKYDAKAGTLTFSTATGRIVLVRVPKGKANPHS